MNDQKVRLDQSHRCAWERSVSEVVVVAALRRSS